MISAGNDIVDLNHVDGVRTSQVRFYSKIISAPELRLYSTGRFPSLSFENFVWLLWSIKESVFKYQKRYNLGLVFSPQKIMINSIGLSENHAVTKFGHGQLEGVSAGAGFFYNIIVRSGHEIFYARSKIYSELIYSFVNGEENFEHMWWGVKFINSHDYETQSRAVRGFIINKFSAIFPDCKLDIVKNNAGVPSLLTKPEKTGIPISLSHHGNFVAYCFLLNQ